jgi:Gas vesicle synthesis protein GvpO
MAETRSSGKRRSATAKGGQAGSSAKQGAKTSDKQAKSGRTPRGGSSSAATSRSAASTRQSRSAPSRGSRGGTQASRKRARTPSGNGARGSGHSSRREGLSAVEAVEQARERLSALLGRPVEGMLGVDRDHGNWMVTAEVVELARIPNTTDVLGEYEVILDKDGDVLRYRRTRRYNRGQVDGGQS